jgi:hypothetical protein
MHTTQIKSILVTRRKGGARGERSRYPMGWRDARRWEEETEDEAGGGEAATAG